MFSSDRHEIWPESVNCPILLDWREDLKTANSKCFLRQIELALGKNIRMCYFHAGKIYVFMSKQWDIKKGNMVLLSLAQNSFETNK